MTELLETKLQPPTPRPSAIERVRLLDRMGRDALPRLVLVSAPPGFGKSTLVAQWIARCGPDVATAWLSLEPADNDAITFWTYLTAAIDRAVPGVGAAAHSQLEAPQPRIDRVVASLANGLATVASELVVVLDDLHAIEAPEIMEGLAFLLDHLPARVHIVVLTRADPALPLARLRARGELVELRAADLRFTGDEAAVYLNDRMGLALQDREVESLEARTEGWIAALQLAAISMKGRSDSAAFIESFAGDDRFVVDYLADEVLERQPERVRQFLLRTSILDRLNGLLCDAVTGESGGTVMLETLDRANLFLIPLDDRRRWYRYHHLFADLLRARLKEHAAADMPALHRRASAWWEANAEPAQAIAHALDAGDADRAAGLIELEVRHLLRTRQEATARRWLDRLPDHVYDRWPVLADAHAGTLLVSGSAHRVDHRLAQAERWLEAARRDDLGTIIVEADGPLATDLEGLRRLPSAVALHRAGLAWMQGDVSSTVTFARRALDVARDAPVEAGGAAAILGLTSWSSGDLAAAHAAWSEGAAALESGGNYADVLGCSIAIADIEITLGRLRDARRTYERCLRLSDAHGDPALRGAAEMHVGLAELFREWNELEQAERHLGMAADLGEALGLPQFPYRSRVARAALLQARGDPEAALSLLDEAERVYDGDFFPDVHPVPSARARIWVEVGRHDDAIAWGRGRGLSLDDEPVYLHEDEHLTFCRAALAKAVADATPQRAEAVVGFLDRLIAAADRGGRGRSVLEATVLRAAARSAAGDNEAAAADLERALAFARPEGFARIFLDEGPVMAALLGAAARRDPASYAAALVQPVDAPARPAPTSSSLVEPLSDRELEVLRLLASDLDGPAIASQLFVSLNTMRTHTKNIFAKLGVNSRRAAVTRATELGLLTRSR